MLKNSELKDIMDTFINNSDDRLITNRKLLKEYLKSLNNLDFLNSNQLLYSLYKKERENREKCFRNIEANKNIVINLKYFTRFTIDYHKLHCNHKNIIEYDNYRTLIYILLRVTHNVHYRDIPEFLENYNILSKRYIPELEPLSSLSYYRINFKIEGIGNFTIDNGILSINFINLDEKYYFLRMWEKIDK